MKKITKLSRILAITLCIVMILTACQSKPKSETSNEENAVAPTAGATSSETEDSAADSTTQDNATDSTAIKTGGTLTVGTVTAMTNVGYTPELGGNAFIKFVRTSYNSLLNYDPEGNLVGELATEWSFDTEARTITYKLREGVTFSDGTPFNAEAVKWNIEEYATNNRTEVADIASIDCVDDYTVTITLNNWNSSKLEAVGFFVLYMSPAAIQANGKEWAYANSCGTGAFVSDAVVEGSSVAYVANKAYWEAGKPYLEKVVFNIFADTNTADYALQNKEIDVLFDAPTTIVTEFKDMPGYFEYSNTSGYGKETLGLIPSSANEKNADGSVNPWYIAEVRQALCYAVDANALNQVLSQGIKSLTNQWAAEGSATYSPNVKGFEYNPEKAKELLTTAGFADGFTTQIYDAGTFTDACTLIQTYLAAVGITVNINTVDSTTFMGYMYNGWEGLYWHFASISPDLGLYMGRHLDTKATFYGMSLQHPEDTLALLEQVRTATNNEDKQMYSWQLQELIYDKYALFGRVINVSAPVIIGVDYVKDGAWGASHASSWSAANCWLDK